jgi:molybdenum cofactor cytidylyltransferase
MNLVQALRLRGSPRLALVGAGGKTTALFQIARQLTPPVIITATTHLAYEQAFQADRWIQAVSPADLPAPEGVQPELLLITGPVSGDGRTQGVAPDVLVGLQELSDHLGCPLLIEADGSRRLPVKAPAEHEPAIPQFCDHVLVSAGLSALGMPLGEKYVHRWERFLAISGLSPGERITPQALARVLLHPQGGLKNIPAGARRAALLNQADSVELQAQAATIAGLLLPAYDAVLIASLGSPGITEQPAESHDTVLSVSERTAGIILAAGASRRYGSPKLLLPWKGAPLIRHVATTALQAGLDPVIVVAGEHAAAIREALEGHPAEVVQNSDWESGQSSTVRAGLEALPEGIGAAVFLLGDQPQIPPSLPKALVELHASTLAPIVAPIVDGQRANPVLFDRVTFSDLLNLSGDMGGRALFSRYVVTWLEWHDPSVLRDIDTPEDYQILLLG